MFLEPTLIQKVGRVFQGFSVPVDAEPLHQLPPDAAFGPLSDLIHDVIHDVISFISNDGPYRPRPPLTLLTKHFFPSLLEIDHKYILPKNSKLVLLIN